MALNKESENSVMAEPGGSQVPADGTGIIHRLFFVYATDEYRSNSIGSLVVPI